MIFRPELAQAILDGRKTETRRPARFENGTEWVRPPYKPGRTYAVQPGRGKKAIGRIRIVGVRWERFFEGLDEAAAHREGFESVREFISTWLDIYGRGNWLDPVNVITFELVEGRS